MHVDLKRSSHGEQWRQSIRKDQLQALSRSDWLVPRGFVVGNHLFERREHGVQLEHHHTRSNCKPSTQQGIAGKTILREGDRSNNVRRRDLFCANLKPTRPVSASLFATWMLFMPRCASFRPPFRFRKFPSVRHPGSTLSTIFASCSALAFALRTAFVPSKKTPQQAADYKNGKIFKIK